MKEALRRAFGIEATLIERHPGGFQNQCWVVDGTWFVKVWDEPPPTAVAVLAQLADRGVPVSPPRPALDGSLTATTDDGRSYAVFAFVQGRDPDEDDWLVMARAVRELHAVDPAGLALASPRTEEDWLVETLPQHLDHPWLRDRRDEVVAAIEWLEGLLAAANQRDVRRVVCHTDCHAGNLLVDEATGELCAILDWDHARIAPREHDLWLVADTDDPSPFLEAYGARDLDRVHVEYALVARALRDLAARVSSETDRPGVETWGFDRLARVPALLDAFEPFFAR